MNHNQPKADYVKYHPQAFTVPTQIKSASQLLPLWEEQGGKTVGNGGKPAWKKEGRGLAAKMMSAAGHSYYTTPASQKSIRQAAVPDFYGL